MLRARWPISDSLLFVVSDDIKILLLLLKAAEETQGSEIEAALGPTVPRCRPKQRFHFFVFVFDSGATARRVKSGHVGKYGRTQAPSHDQPVCFDGWLRRRSSEAAPPSGPLAV